jgi:hypothetical protein
VAQYIDIYRLYKLKILKRPPMYVLARAPKPMYSNAKKDYVRC